MMFCFICAILCLFSRVEGSIEAVEQIHSVTSCYNSTNTISASCPNGTVIAVYEFYYGFKNKSSPCTSSECCDYEVGDCLQPNTARDVMYALSGNQNGQTPTVNIAVGATCKNETSEAVSSFNLLKYMCILENRTWNIDEKFAVNVTSELTVYIESLNYPGIMPGESEGTCSVEALSATQIEMYTLHAEFLCSVQRLDIVDDSHGLLATIDCNTTVFGFIAEESLNTNYVNISLFNNDADPSGKFWIGFKATSDDTAININCPAQPRIFFKGCGNVPASEGTTVVYTDATAAYDSIATASCADGYVNNSGDETRTCQANNTWSGEPYTCIRAPDCQELPPPPHGNITTSDGYVGDAVEYSCDEGYDLSAQNATRVCTETGNWTGNALVCVPKDCGQLLAPVDGNVAVSTTTFGSHATYSCSEFYNITSGDVMRTCQADGTWSGQQPNCSLTVDCLDDDHCSNNYACVQRKCIYTCQDPPQISNAAADVNNQPPTPGSTATYRCEDGFTLQGDPTRTCINGSGWTGAEQTCVKHCDNLADPQNGAVTVNGTGSLGTSATFTCKEGFILQGSSKLVCREGSVWSSNVPKCSKEGTTETQTTNDSIALAIVVPILLLIILALVLFILYRKRVLSRKSHYAGKNKTDDIQCQSMSTLKSKDETQTVKESEETAKGDAKCPIANGEGVDLDHPENKKEEKEEAAPDKESGDASSTQTSEQPQQKEASNDGKEPGDNKETEDSGHGDKAYKTEAPATNQEKTDDTPSDAKDTDLIEIDFGGTQHSADSAETPNGEGSK